MFGGGFAAEAGVDSAVVVGVFDPGGDPGVDLVAGGDGTPVVVLGCEGGPQGFGHGVIPAHLGLPHRHGSFRGAHVGGQLLGGELCSPISVEHDGALLLAHGVSQDSTRVRIAHGAQVDSALRAPQVGEIRDPHAVSRVLVPLAGAVVLMGHWTPPTALAVMRARM